MQALSAASVGPSVLPAGPFVLHVSDLPQDICAQFHLAGHVAWDIETTGLDWRFERIALCQLHADEIGTHIVRISPGEVPVHMRALLESNQVLKLFHYALFDLRFMAAHWSCRPASIRCTKVASKVLDPKREEHSLKSLLAEHMGVQIDKAERLSNWLAPALSREQLSYASNDVRFLPHLFEALSEKLQHSGRWPVAVRCFEFLPVQLDLDLASVTDVFGY